MHGEADARKSDGEEVKTDLFLQSFVSQKVNIFFSRPVKTSIKGRTGLYKQSVLKKSFKNNNLPFISGRSFD